MTPVGTAAIWAGLSLEDRAALLGLAMPSMRRAPLLLRLRHDARQAGLAQRHILSTTGQRQQFIRYLVASGRLSDD